MWLHIILTVLGFLRNSATVAIMCTDFVAFEDFDTYIHFDSEHRVYLMGSQE